MENTNKPMKGYMIIGGVIVVLVVIALLGLARKGGMNTANQGPGMNANGTKVIPTIDVAKPAVAFTKASETGHAVDEEFSVVLFADSKGADVEGYDLLFPQDKTKLEIVRVKSVLPTFQIYQFDRPGGYYSVTGVKLLSVTAPTVFNNTPLLEITLKGKAKGTYYLEVMPDRGKEMSKFVAKGVKVIKPQFQPVMVEIK